MLEHGELLHLVVLSKSPGLMVRRFRANGRRMKLRLAHLLIVIAIGGFGAIVLPPILRSAGLPVHGPAEVIWLISLFSISIVLAWPVCRVLGIPPLFIFAGPCPHCARRPRVWGVIHRQMPRVGRMPDNVELACGLCRGKLILWLRLSAPSKIGCATTPNFCLRWPPFLGLWRRLVP
jgi:hypothetical protein